MMLAQLTKDMLPGWAQFTLCVGGMLWLLDMGFRIAARFKGKPSLPPNELLEAAHEQLKGSHKQLTKRVELVESDIRGVRDELKNDRGDQEKHISERAGSIYRTIDGFVGELRKEMSTQSDRREEMLNETRRELESKMEANRKELSDRMNDLPSQVVALLKNTNAI